MAYTYTVTAHSHADPDAVFSILLRPGSWPLWSRIDAAEAEVGDPGDPQRAGDIRIFRTGRAVSHERIVELITDKRFAYENVNGPFRFYRGAVELTRSHGGGTDIVWSAHFAPKLPLSGPFWRWYLTRFMQGMADGLARHAEGSRH
ncbi:SRPBCC family protein [Streptomyces sp. SID8361]|uniref:SRPBCC family protein n=1 Tax=Streptomyces TaxID=1883 RepID=UPI00081EFA53|nr:SRPBCC family protein [Streptomyces sp. MnatMP-M27]AUA15270.1 Polyketide cyclase / dehydrase and lipid transport [Streptomyces sp. M56]MYU14434.1 SRPBCC family protein [Streptomyces sp. SID8361]MYX63493.1 SRPBCC family protein [Streptomyces sp. SID8382]SCG05911.1 Polyketide cyclase / dehydrase and lipid transport [Streptomyces sp. MnatMP-M27]